MKFRIHYVVKDPTMSEREFRTKYKRSVASATNFVTRCHTSLSHNLVMLQVEHSSGWVEYDMPWIPAYSDVKARLEEIAEFHESFYGEGV